MWGLSVPNGFVLVLIQFPPDVELVRRLLGRGEEGLGREVPSPTEPELKPTPLLDVCVKTWGVRPRVADVEPDVVEDVSAEKVRIDVKMIAELLDDFARKVFDDEEPEPDSVAA